MPVLPEAAPAVHRSASLLPVSASKSWISAGSMKLAT
jgi:hypothetical protein